MAEIRAGLSGAWRLALADRGAMAAFDRSRHGIWKSFQAVILLCAGPTLLTVMLSITDAKLAQSGWTLIILVEAIAFVVHMTAFPLAMSPFCHWLDRDKHFAGFIVAYNWISVLQTVLYLASAVIAAVVPGGAFLMLVALLASLVYEGFAFSVALEVSRLPATAIVLLDLVISLVVTRITDGLY